MTDADIIKALECCVTIDGCKKCPRGKNGKICKDYNEFIRAILDLINCQKAEIDDLKRDTIPKLLATLERANRYGIDADKENERQKAEIERLKKIQQTQADRIVEERGRRYEIASEMCIFRKRLETEKAEAIKKFAERLKKKSQLVTPSVYAVPFRAIAVDDINNLVKETVGDDMSERKYIAISIKHTDEKWKLGKPCVLWGHKRTRDDEKRCFAGYTECLENAELYAADDLYNHGYAEDIIKREPVKMCADLCRKYTEYDTVLMLEAEYRKYYEIITDWGDDS